MESSGTKLHVSEKFLTTYPMVESFFRFALGTRYWTCWNGTATEQLCIGGLLYNEPSHSCDWPEVSYRIIYETVSYQRQLYNCTGFESKGYLFNTNNPRIPIKNYALSLSLSTIKNLPISDITKPLLPWCQIQDSIYICSTFDSFSHLIPERWRMPEAP